ncbi:MAG: hypothetical protein NVS2B16_28340 [Chloroflexota bacterium]
MNAAIMAREIGEQPDVLRRIEEEGRGPIERVAGGGRLQEHRFSLSLSPGASPPTTPSVKSLVRE